MKFTSLFAMIGVMALCLVGLGRPAAAQSIGWDPSYNSQVSWQYIDIGGNLYHTKDSVYLHLNWVTYGTWYASCGSAPNRVITVDAYVVIDQAYYWWSGGWDSNHYSGNGYYPCTVVSAPTETYLSSFYAYPTNDDTFDEYISFDVNDGYANDNGIYAETPVKYDYHYQFKITAYNPSLDPSPGWDHSGYGEYRYSASTYNDPNL